MMQSMQSSPCHPHLLWLNHDGCENFIARRTVFLRSTKTLKSLGEQKSIDFQAHALIHNKSNKKCQPREASGAKKNNLLWAIWALDCEDSQLNNDVLAGNKSSEILGIFALPLVFEVLISVPLRCELHAT